MRSTTRSIASCFANLAAWAITVSISGAAHASDCSRCHPEYRVFSGHGMSGNSREAAFISRAFRNEHQSDLAKNFARKNCASCHVKGCESCHGKAPHGDGSASQKPLMPGKPGDTACLRCHRDYFIGGEYYGRAPREDHARYQRGPQFAGEYFLKMLPDVHQEKGLECHSCHSMKSLAAGKKSSKTCRDCHQANPSVLEHRISAHLEKMECYACHSAWAAQEYGTFFLHFSNESRTAESNAQELFDLNFNKGEYAKSSYLKKQDAPPLGLNAAGKVSPIRPQFILYFSEIGRGRAIGKENRQLAAEWRAFFPHTVRRGTPMCDACHDNPRRFVCEKPESKIYELRKDGFALDSFWDRSGQKMVNGEFMPVDRVAKMREKNRAYKKAYVEKWKSLIDRVETR